MRFSAILLLAAASLGLVSCQSEEQNKARGVPRVSPRGLTITSYVDDSQSSPEYAQPVLDPDTGCEYLMSRVHGGASLTIRYNRDGTPRCPDAKAK